MSVMSLPVLLLGSAGCLFIIGVVLLCSGGGEKKEKEKTNHKFDPDYALLFTERYLQKGNIEDALEDMKDIYTKNTFMTARINEAINYLNGDYGDYESALSLINKEGDPAVEKAHSDAITSEIAKKIGLPGA